MGGNVLNNIFMGRLARQVNWLQQKLTSRLLLISVVRSNATDEVGKALLSLCQIKFVGL